MLSRHLQRFTAQKEPDAWSFGEWFIIYSGGRLLSKIYSVRTTTRNSTICVWLWGDLFFSLPHVDLFSIIRKMYTWHASFWWNRGHRWEFEKLVPFHCSHLNFSSQKRLTNRHNKNSREQRGSPLMEFSLKSTFHVTLWIFLHCTIAVNAHTHTVSENSDV